MKPITISDLVVDIVARRLDLAEGTLDRSVRLEDLGADSVAVVELALALEEAFDIEIADEQIETLRSVQDVVDCVERALGRGDDPAAARSTRLEVRSMGA